MGTGFILESMDIHSVSEFTHLSAPREVQALVQDDTTVAVTTVGDMDNNCYLIACDGQGLLIDAADDAEHLLDMAKALKVEITDVLTTHQHFDHTRALQEVLEATGATHHAPRKDAEGIPAPADEVYGNDEGIPELLRLTGHAAELQPKVVELRGHTPGGLAVLLENVEDAPRAFTGDSIFPGGVGKTDSPEAFSQLLTDVEQRILSLPQGTRIHPGHGDSTTVGAELPHVDEWRQRGW